MVIFISPFYTVTKIPINCLVVFLILYLNKKRAMRFFEIAK